MKIRRACPAQEGKPYHERKTGIGEPASSDIKLGTPKPSRSRANGVRFFCCHSQNCWRWQCGFQLRGRASLDRRLALDGTGQAWLTMSVQLGFVVGAFGSAVLTLADRLFYQAVVCRVRAAGCACHRAHSAPRNGPACCPRIAVPYRTFPGWRLFP